MRNKGFNTPYSKSSIDKQKELFNIACPVKWSFLLFNRGQLRPPITTRYRVQGGIGALVVKEDVGRYAEKAGLYVMTQTDEGGAALLNRDDFEPKEFS